MPLFASLTLKETALKEAACVRLPKYRLPFMVKGLTVTHEFLQIHLTDNLAHLSEHHLGDLTGHLGLIHIEIILRCYLDQFGSLSNLEICDSASMDKNRHTLQTEDNERALS